MFYIELSGEGRNPLKSGQYLKKEFIGEEINFANMFSRNPLKSGQYLKFANMFIERNTKSKVAIPLNRVSI